MSAHIISRDERLTTIENILFHSPEGVRVVELANACEVDRRTIYRDMAKLRANGVPIYQKQGRFFVSREYYLASVQLNVHETTALFTAVRVMAQVSEQQNPHAVSALAKLSAALPVSLGNHVDLVTRLMREIPVDRLFVMVTEKLTRAWGERRWVRLWYRGESQPMDLAPYFLEPSAQGKVYVVGVERCDTYRIRALRLNGILRVELLSEVFELHHQFDATRYLSDDTGLLPDDATRQVVVTLAFKPDVARLVLARRLRVVSETTMGDDGRVYAHLRVRDWHDLLPWVRSLGANVEVIKPDSLRRTVAEEARQLSMLYGADEQNEQEAHA